MLFHKKTSDMDVFTSSLHFPDYSNGSGMLECLDTLTPVFSFDVSQNGAKHFFACGYEHFVKWYGSKLGQEIPQHIYEVIQFNKPTKLFFDFDAKNTDMESFKTVVNDFLYHSVSKLSELHDHTFDIDHIFVLNASTESKCSYHVIFQYFFDNVQTIKDTVHHLVETFDKGDVTDFVDFSVYSQNRSFRLLFSSKKGKTNYFKLNGHPNEYNEQVMFDSLVQGRLDDHYSGPLSESPFRGNHKIIFSTVTRKSSSIKSHGSFVRPSDMPNRLVDYIKIVTNGQGYIRSSKMMDDFIQCIIGNMKCPHKKDKHKSNNQYFIFNTKTNFGWFRCADNECSQMIYKKDKLNWLWV